MLNQSDSSKLLAAVEMVLRYMVAEGLQQLKVRHKDLHKLAGLGNTRGASLRTHVDEALARDIIVKGGFGWYLLADFGTEDGESVMVFIKQQKLLNTLNIDPVSGKFTRKP